MVIYVEYVIFDNFLLDLFIALLVCNLLHMKSRRAFLSACLGTILAVVYPCVQKELVALFKLLTLLTCCLPFTQKKLLPFIKSIFFYSVVAFIFNGLISFGLNIAGEYGFYNSGGTVGIIAGGAIIGYLIIYKFANLLISRISKESFVKLTLCIGDKKMHAMGFVDTGNIATASNGKGIIFLDKSLSRKIHSDTIDYVFINTVGANKIFKVIKIDKLLIYFDGKEHIYIDVNAIKTDQTYQGFQILLSSKLEEVCA